jgi:hypothetical protein
MRTNPFANEIFTIKSTIGFSIAIALLLAGIFASSGGMNGVSAAAIGTTAEADMHDGGHDHGGTGRYGDYHGNGGNGNGGHDRPDFDRPESPEVQAAVSDLREATARFHDIEVAKREGYAPFGDCFANPPEGNMGYHYANANWMADPGVDINHPELLLYEKQEDGTFKFIAVEYLAFQKAWHDAGNKFKPRLFGEWFHLNSVLLPEPFYLLHVWHVKHNPSGRFVDWNPDVVCR